MRRLWFLVDSLNTRARLLALLLIVIVPYSALLIYSTVERHGLLQANAEAQTLNLAQAVAANQNDVLEHTFRLLKTLANHPSVRQQDWKACGAMIAEFWQHFQDVYSNFHISDIQGNVKCSGMYLPKPVNVADRRDFEDAVRTKTYVVGDLVRSRTTNLLSLITRYPVVDESGEVVAVVSGQISTEQFDQATSGIAMPAQSELIILDRGEKILVRRPHPRSWIGQSLPQGPLLQAFLSADKKLVEARGVDGITRLYGLAKTGRNDENALQIAVGLPVQSVHAEVNRHLYGNIALMLAIVFLALAAAWFGVDALVLRKVNVLIGTVNKLRSGETSARTGIRYGEDELSHVAQAIDETADELERVLNLLRDQNVHDALTGLYNRRYLDERMLHETAKAERENRSIGVIMADIDYFKRINDTYGHDGGDVVLTSVAKILQAHVRDGDIVCRFGGEEFCVILPGAGLEITLARAESLRVAVSELRLELNGQALSLSISLGVSVFPTHGRNGADLLHMADTALYAAKESGRNRAMVAANA